MRHVNPQRIPHLNRKRVVKGIACRLLDGEQIFAFCIGLGDIRQCPTGIAGDFGGGTIPLYLGQIIFV
jgi:hypothetical protein